MSKLVTLAVAAGAYVLGTKAGRERYEQISTKANSLWGDPKVQQKKQEALGLAKDTAGRAKDKAAKKTDKSSSEPEANVKPPAPTHAGPAQPVTPEASR